MELVGTHKQALSALDSIEGGHVSEKISTSKENGSTSSNGGVAKNEKHQDVQNDKADEVAEAKGQLVQEEEREKGRVGFSVYWKYITSAYGGALVPFILLAQILFQTLQIGSNYWMAWATPVSEDAKPPVGGSTLIIVYVALAIGSSFCILGRATLLVTAGYKQPASTDQSALDLNILFQVGAFAFSMIQLLGIIIVMSQVAWQ
ncbi:hypothetical protein Pint_03951 [Pistacia integerrima]|uniref:Uncharacterized protein n=1 Tax=Pistacia integerrima TaxID=434235 RepID=A0ACC0Z753_9ROSI|nr:hypothetical protein Pint_03951 [Pistacia integerrima]